MIFIVFLISLGNPAFLPIILILTPCLAFDLKGYRMGYGGGYYDKTFYKFKQSKQPFVSVAVAFEDQKVDKLISDDKDQKINFILTEKQIYKIK